MPSQFRCRKKIQIQPKLLSRLRPKRIMPAERSAQCLAEGARACSVMAEQIALRRGTGKECIAIEMPAHQHGKDKILCPNPGSGEGNRPDYQCQTKPGITQREVPTPDQDILPNGTRAFLNNVSGRGIRIESSTFKDPVPSQEKQKSSWALRGLMKTPGNVSQYDEARVGMTIGILAILRSPGWGRISYLSRVVLVAISIALHSFPKPGDAKSRSGPTIRTARASSARAVGTRSAGDPFGANRLNIWMD